MLIIPDEYSSKNVTQPEGFSLPEGMTPFGMRTEGTSALLTHMFVKESASMPFNDDQSIIDSLHQFEIQIVDSLPVEGTSHILYFVPFQDGDEDTLYEEYVWITTVDAETSEPTGYFEKVGMTTADLGNYYTSSEVDGLLADKVDIDLYATEYVAGITKIYDTTGYNFDGTMTQYAITNAISDILVSPALTGTPTAPTVADPEDNSNKIATTEFVQNAIQLAIERFIDSGIYSATAGTAEGEELSTAEFELLAFNVTASSE
jgi:hypothetical protein